MNKLKLFSTIVLFLSFCNYAYADDKDKAVSSAIDKVTSPIESAIENIISGEGDSEVSISSGEDAKPTISIMGVRPLSPHTDNSNLFIQFQLNTRYINNNSRMSISAGMGKRYLSEDKNTITGINAFLDYDDEGNTRSSIGLEFRRSAVEAIVNAYFGLSNANEIGAFTERVLDGNEITIIGEVPYIPWANIVFNHYEWQADKNSKNSKGDKFSAELALTPNLIVEVGQDSNNIDGSNNFAKVSVVYPSRDRVSLKDGITADVMFTSGDISSQMLSKVRRTNTMIIESEGTGVVIARATE